MYVLVLLYVSVCILVCLCCVLILSTVCSVCGYMNSTEWQVGAACIVPMQCQSPWPSSIAYWCPICSLHSHPINLSVPDLALVIVNDDINTSRIIKRDSQCDSAQRLQREGNGAKDKGDYGVLVGTLNGNLFYGNWLHDTMCYSQIVSKTILFRLWLTCICLLYLYSQYNIMWK